MRDQRAQPLGRSRRLEIARTVDLVRPAVARSLRVADVMQPRGGHEEILLRGVIDGRS